MNFLKRIKNDLNDPRKRRSYGHAPACTTNAEDLRELIYHFENIDSELRAQHNVHAHINQRLSEAITAVYMKQHKNSELTLLIIMETLGPLIEERHKELEIIARTGA